MKKFNVNDVYTRTQAHLKLGMRQNRIYIWEDNNWRVITHQDLAILIRSLFSSEDQQTISVACINEVIERLMQNPKLQLIFTEEKEDKFVKLKHSIFNVETGKIEELAVHNFGYFLDFDYIEPPQRNLTVFSKYITSTFPEETEQKLELLLQIIGYILSDYQKAKAGFFFIGESNSGKSTILELIRKIFPEHSVTNIPLYRLENRFNLARLADARINICTELSEKSFSASDMFKILTSNEMVTAEHKGCKPFEFKLRCKSLNAGNCIPEIKNNNGMIALLNRMVILLFPISIDKDKQDIELINKLWEERDSIFSAALDALVQLQKNNFHFTEPDDSTRLKRQLTEQGNVIQNFLDECCVFENNGREHLSNLYAALDDYCHDNLLEMKYTKAHFSQYLCKLSQIRRGKFRIQGSKPLAGVIGLRLKKQEEYTTQDSETYSKNYVWKYNARNNGTQEQEDITNE